MAGYTVLYASERVKPGSARAAISENRDCTTRAV